MMFDKERWGRVINRARFTAPYLTGFVVGRLSDHKHGIALMIILVIGGIVYVYMTRNVPHA